MLITFDYFDDIKRKMEQDAVYKLIYYMKKNIKKQKAKRKAAADKKAAAQPQKDKYGRIIKKAPVSTTDTKKQPTNVSANTN